MNDVARRVQRESINRSLLEQGQALKGKKMKTTRILAISVLVLVVGLPAGVAKAAGDPRPTVSVDDGAEWLDVRYDDEAYFVIDCYLDSNGDAWILWWDCLDGTARWELEIRIPQRPNVR